ncbi:MAG: TetR/AcrR family transcriptional regulator [Saprospiraceae bacterium]|nr:TetR/AcrR family transcriptional regulator [Pyrinomonadaceae bacterium]
MKDAVQQRDTKASILNATDRLLSRHGYRKMTIDDLAAEVGIGKGSVYLHFSSKEEIVLSHIDRIIERLKTRLHAIAAKDLSCDERLKLMLVERVMFRFDSVQHYTQNLNDMLAQIRQNLLERRKRYFIEEARIFAQVIEEGGKTFELAGADPLESAKTLLSATNSLLPFSLTTSELGERGEIESKVRRLADVLLEGLIRRK